MRDSIVKKVPVYDVGVDSFEMFEAIVDINLMRVNVSIKVIM